MASSAPTTALRQLLESRFSDLAAEIEQHLSAELSSRCVEAGDRARRDAADRLNQSVRRLRASKGLSELAATLLDATSPFAEGAALFRVDSGALVGERIRGASDEAAARFSGLRLPLERAAAMADAVETRDPVAAVATPSEVTGELSSLLSREPEDRVWIFPLDAGGRVPALLYVWGKADAAAIELFAQCAAMLWDDAAKSPAPELVSIAPAGSPASAWDSLSPDEQRVHLRAQRLARVQVAEMRLYHGAEVQAGRIRRDLYDTLRGSIDGARAAFREQFFATCPSMVDYLHLELQRTLANDDPELLGKDYPGPMV